MLKYCVMILHWSLLLSIYIVFCPIVLSLNTPISSKTASTRASNQCVYSGNTGFDSIELPCLPVPQLNKSNNLLSKPELRLWGRSPPLVNIALFDIPFASIWPSFEKSRDLGQSCLSLLNFPRDIGESVTRNKWLIHKLGHALSATADANSWRPIANGRFFQKSHQILSFIRASKSNLSGSLFQYRKNIADNTCGSFVSKSLPRMSNTNTSYLVLGAWFGIGKNVAPETVMVKKPLEELGSTLRDALLMSSNLFTLNGLRKLLPPMVITGGALTVTFTFQNWLKQIKNVVIEDFLTQLLIRALAGQDVDEIFHLFKAKIPFFSFYKKEIFLHFTRRYIQNMEFFSISNIKTYTHLCFKLFHFNKADIFEVLLEILETPSNLQIARQVMILLECLTGSDSPKLNLLPRWILGMFNEPKSMESFIQENKEFYYRNEVKKALEAPLSIHQSIAASDGYSPLSEYFELKDYWKNCLNKLPPPGWDVIGLDRNVAKEVFRTFIDENLEKLEKKKESGYFDESFDFDSQPEALDKDVQLEDIMHFLIRYTDGREDRRAFMKPYNELFLPPVNENDSMYDVPHPQKSSSHKFSKASNGSYKPPKHTKATDFASSIENANTLKNIINFDSAQEYYDFKEDNIRKAELRWKEFLSGILAAANRSGKGAEDAISDEYSFEERRLNVDAYHQACVRNYTLRILQRLEYLKWKQAKERGSNTLTDEKNAATISDEADAQLSSAEAIEKIQNSVYETADILEDDQNLAKKQSYTDDSTGLLKKVLDDGYTLVFSTGHTFSSLMKEKKVLLENPEVKKYFPGGLDAYGDNEVSDGSNSIQFECRNCGYNIFPHAAPHLSSQTSANLNEEESNLGDSQNEELDTEQLPNTRHAYFRDKHFVCPQCGSNKECFDSVC